MSSTGQTMNIGNLLGTGQTAITVPNSTIGQSFGDDSNLLINKTFSDFMKEQVRTGESNVGSSQKALKELTVTQLDTAILTQETIDSLFVFDASGNPLPVSELTLPLTDENKNSPESVLMSLLALANNKPDKTEAAEDQTILLSEETGLPVLGVQTNNGVEQITITMQDLKTLAGMLNQGDSASPFSTKTSPLVESIAASLGIKKSGSNNLAAANGQTTIVNNIDPSTGTPIDAKASTGQANTSMLTNESQVSPSTVTTTVSVSTQQAMSDLATQAQLLKPISKAVIKEGMTTESIKNVDGTTSQSITTANALSAETAKTATTDSATIMKTAIPQQVGKQGWSDNVMQRVMWMSSQHINRAEIALDPPELGPLQVRISNQGDQTSVIFTSNHAVVRDALDQGLPRLREMMESQGINLADVDVSDQRASEQEKQDLAASEADGIAQNDDEFSESVDDTGTLSGSNQNRIVNGLVDHYV